MVELTDDKQRKSVSTIDLDGGTRLYRCAAVRRARPADRDGRGRAMKPDNRVVHCRRAAFDVYIGRPSKWGNPFVIGRDGTRTEVIAKYQAWLDTQPALLEVLPELRGKILGCWCAPEACHGDMLARLAEGATP